MYARALVYDRVCECINAMCSNRWKQPAARSVSCTVKHPKLNKRTLYYYIIVCTYYSILRAVVRDLSIARHIISRRPQIDNCRHRHVNVGMVWGRTFWEPIRDESESSLCRSIAHLSIPCIYCAYNVDVSLDITKGYWEVIIFGVPRLRSACYSSKIIIILNTAFKIYRSNVSVEFTQQLSTITYW